MNPPKLVLSVIGTTDDRALREFDSRDYRASGSATCRDGPHKIQPLKILTNTHFRMLQPCHRHTYFTLRMSDPSPLSHYDDAGRARMVDVGGKSATSRRAIAQGVIAISEETIAALDAATLPKGNPFEVARIAAIQATKRTPELIPLCHPLRLTAIDVDLVLDRGKKSISATVMVAAEEKTGVEMEALVGCSVALLTVYDMLKAIDHAMVIGPITLLEKTGGQSDFTAPPAP